MFHDLMEHDRLNRVPETTDIPLAERLEKINMEIAEKKREITKLEFRRGELILLIEQYERAELARLKDKYGG